MEQNAIQMNAKEFISFLKKKKIFKKEYEKHYELIKPLICVFIPNERKEFLLKDKEAENKVKILELYQKN